MAINTRPTKQLFHLKASLVNIYPAQIAAVPKNMEKPAKKEASRQKYNAKNAKICNTSADEHLTLSVAAFLPKDNESLKRKKLHRATRQYQIMVKP